MGNLKAAEKLLTKHNMGLKVWPPGGGRQKTNSLRFGPYGKSIPNNRTAYRQLRKCVFR
jgi:hypothetical protein